MTDSRFHTFKEDMCKDESSLTPSMEDYLEMVYRLSEDKGFTRIQEIAAALNVKPPSATRMVKKLSFLGYLHYERYGLILLEKKGLVKGHELIERHYMLESFFELLAIDEKMILSETEKVEHTLSSQSILAIQKLLNFFNSDENIIKRYKAFISIK